TFPFIPMVPIALLSDPCAPPNSTNNNTNQNTLSCWQSKGSSTWEGAIMARKGFDQLKMGTDPNTNLPVPAAGPDGIPEISLTLTEKGSSSDNAQLVYLDSNKVGSVATLLTQLQDGVVYGDLPANNGQAAGQFLLNASDNFPPPASGTPP